jgi:hypothetical protein
MSRDMRTHDYKKNAPEYGIGLVWR